MNRYVENCLTNIKNSMTTYQSGVRSAVTDRNNGMTKATNQSENYITLADFEKIHGKGANTKGVVIREYYLKAKTDELNEEARQTIAMCEETMRNEITAELQTLKKELNSYLLEVPSDYVLAILNFYNTFGVAPSKSEINAIIDASGGGYLTEVALNAISAKNHGRYRIDCPSADDYQKGIDVLEDITKGHIIWGDRDSLATVIKIFNGTDRYRKNGDGDYITIGDTHTTGTINGESMRFENAFNSIDGMIQKWGGNMPPKIIVVDDSLDTAGKRKAIEEFMDSSKRVTENIKDGVKELTYADRHPSIDELRSDKSSAEVMNQYLHGSNPTLSAFTD